MLTLYIGNKNYSSWSLRPWLLMRALDIPFQERQLWLFTDGFRSALQDVAPTARVPVLVDDGFAIWDSLAIVEYLAERFPQAGVWPADTRARARARSICAEMHSGFGAVRNQLPMNVEARIPGIVPDAQARADIDRIVAAWCAARSEHGDGGPFLFGRFSAADAFFAPVASRFRTYEVALPTLARDWADAVLECPAMRAWTAEALAEHRFLPEDEPYRSAPQPG